jgi:transcriptional regulator with XRE-family HTH domain
VVKQLRIVGPTDDGRDLVVALDGDEDHFVLPVDDDFLEAVEEVAGDLLDGNRDAGDGAEPGDGAESASAGVAGTGVVSAGQAGSQPTGEEERAATPAPGGSGGPARGEPVSQLPPREIQARLRAGESIRKVAQAAGISTERVERWLRAVEGEREQVLAAWRTARLSRPRLGPSHDLLGDAVRINLRAKGVDPETARWKVRRADGQDFWTVDIRYTSRGRTQRARYRYYPERAQVEARNDLAEKLGWTRSSNGTTAAAASQGLAPAPASGRSSRKTTAKKSAAKKGTSTKAATKKATSKKATSTKAATKKATSKKATGQTRTAGKGAGKKTTAKASAKKAGGKKTAAKKATSKGTGRKSAGTKRTGGTSGSR